MKEVKNEDKQMKNMYNLNNYDLYTIRVNNGHICGYCAEFNKALFTLS